MTSYYKGCMDGLYDQFRAMQETSEERALIVTHKKAIGEFLEKLENFSGKTFHSKRNKKTYDSDAYFRGVKDGKEVSLNRQLHNNKKQLIDEN